MEYVRHEAHRRRSIGIVVGERHDKLEDGACIVAWRAHDKFIDVAPSTLNCHHSPLCTKRTASQMSVLSVDGVTYMPVGQCSSCRRDAYSMEIAARVTGLMNASKAGPVGSTVDTSLEDTFLDRPPRSSVGEATNPLNIAICGVGGVL